MKALTLQELTTMVLRLHVAQKYFTSDSTDNDKNFSNGDIIWKFCETLEKETIKKLMEDNPIILETALNLDSHLESDTDYHVAVLCDYWLEEIQHQGSLRGKLNRLEESRIKSIESIKFSEEKIIELKKKCGLI